MLVQKLWKKSFTWDEILPEKIQKEWKEIQKLWNEVKEIIIPRKLTKNGIVADGELHAFVDASLHTYATVLYLRNKTQQGYQSNLVLSKNRLAPIKGTSIPRLELLALLIGVRAISYVERELKLPIIRRIVWCDSKCVLYWLKTSKILSVLVMNRLKEIKEAKGIKIHCVPSEENAADLATQGCKSRELIRTESWWKGPSWLQQDESL